VTVLSAQTSKGQVPNTAKDSRSHYGPLLLGGILYRIAGVVFMIMGGLLIVESGRRYVRFRKAIRLLREKEARLGYEIGTMI
jgi:hypothetical protein